MKKFPLITLAALLSFAGIKPAASQIWLLAAPDAMITGGDFYVGSDIKVGWQYGEEGTEMLGLGTRYFPLENVDITLFVWDTNFVTLEVPSKVKSSLLEIRYEYRHYLFDTEPDDFYGFYTIIGAGMWIVSSKIVPGQYDKAIYSIPEGFPMKYTNTSWRLPIGFGFDWTVMGNFWIFSEAEIELPANEVNGMYVGNDFGASIHVNVGARFMLVDL